MLRQSAEEGLEMLPGNRPIILMFLPRVLRSTLKVPMALHHRRNVRVATSIGRQSPEAHHRLKIMSEICDSANKNACTTHSFLHERAGHGSADRPDLASGARRLCGPVRSRLTAALRPFSLVFLVTQRDTVSRCGSALTSE